MSKVPRLVTLVRWSIQPTGLTFWPWLDSSYLQLGVINDPVDGPASCSWLLAKLYIPLCLFVRSLSFSTLQHLYTSILALACYSESIPPNGGPNNLDRCTIHR